MESIFVKNKFYEMKKEYRDFNLLPNYCKKIALSLLGLLLIIFILSKLKVVNDLTEFWRTIFRILVILGMMILAFSKDKNEDELRQRSRLKALSASFIFGAIFVILTPLKNIILGDGFFSEQIGGFQLMLTMLLNYFWLMYMMKRAHEK